VTTPYADQTDRALLRALRRGDDAAARALYSRLSPALLLQARTLLRDHALAEDAVNAAFCKVMSMSRREIDRIESPIAWLATAVRRQALNILRTNRRMASRIAEAKRRAQANAVRLTDGVSEFDELSRAVSALPRRLAETVVLRHVASLTFDQMAAALGVNRNTIASRYYEAINRLRAALEDPRAPIKLSDSPKEAPRER